MSHASTGESSGDIPCLAILHIAADGVVEEHADLLLPPPATCSFRAFSRSFTVIFELLSAVDPRRQSMASLTCQRCRSGGFEERHIFLPPLESDRRR